MQDSSSLGTGLVTTCLKKPILTVRRKMSSGLPCFSHTHFFVHGCWWFRVLIWEFTGVYNVPEQSSKQCMHFFRNSSLEDFYCVFIFCSLCESTSISLLAAVPSVCPELHQAFKYLYTTVQTAELRLWGGKLPAAARGGEKLIRLAGGCSGKWCLQVPVCSVAGVKCSKGGARIVKVKLQPQPPLGSTPVLFCQVQHLQSWSFYCPHRISESQKCCIVCCAVCIIIRICIVVKEELTVINCSIDCTGFFSHIRRSVFVTPPCPLCVSWKAAQQPLFFIF